MAHIQGDSVEEIHLEAEERMEHVVSDLHKEMAKIRTGRASINLLDGIVVDYYGTPTPLNQMATLGSPEASLLTIQPWDASQTSAIEKAIMQSDLGLTPSSDGKIIRLPIPALNEERRRELVKQLHHVLEHHRVAVRNIRRDANDAVKKLLHDKAIPEDEERLSHKEIQDLTNEKIGQIETDGKKKEDEIMTIG